MIYCGHCGKPTYAAVSVCRACGLETAPAPEPMDIMQASQERDNVAREAARVRYSLAQRQDLYGTVVTLSSGW